MNRLDKSAESMAKAILRCDRMRVISHNDADGITSAGLISTALARAGIPYHTTLVQRLDESVVSFVEGPVIFCDMGSGQPSLISKVKGEVFVMDHHRPVGALDCLNLNPHQFGIDGAFELSAAGTVYSVVRRMGDNTDLAGLALVGAMGDRQAMIGANKAIFDEAVKAGVVEARPGLKMAEDGEVKDVFANSIEPVFDFKKNGGLGQFLEEVGVSGRVEELKGEPLSRLSTAVVLKLLMQGSFAADSIVGKAVRLKKEVIENAFEMVLLLNAIGKMDMPGAGLALCMRDISALDECRSAALKYKEAIVSGLSVLQEGIREMSHIRYLITSDMKAGGVIAGLGIRYLYPNRPLVVLNNKEGSVRISARGNKPLVRAGLDLSVALRRAGEAVGGVGGGHTIASGASISPGTEERFLAMVDEIVGEQLGHNATAAAPGQSPGNPQVAAGERKGSANP